MAEKMNQTITYKNGQTTVKYTSNLGQVIAVTDDKFKRIARVIGDTIEKYAKKAAPVDTGLLKNSITWGVSGEGVKTNDYKADIGDGKGTYDNGKIPDAGEGKVSIVVGSNVEYAPYQELGAPNINLPAHPYLRPAIEDHIAEYQQIMNDIMAE